MKKTKYIFSIFLLFAVATSCKKEKKSDPPQAPPPVNVVPALVLPLTSFPNNTGNTWVYGKNYTTVNYNGVTTTTSTGNPANNTFTIQVLGDTTLPNASLGKKWQFSYPDPLDNHKQVAYIDAVTNLFTVKPIGFGNVNFMFNLKYPMNAGNQWVNTGMAIVDTSKVMGQELFNTGFNSYNVLNINRGGPNGNPDWGKIKVNEKGIVYLNIESLVIINTQITQNLEEYFLKSVNF